MFDMETFKMVHSELIILKVKKQKGGEACLARFQQFIFSLATQGQDAAILDCRGEPSKTIEAFKNKIDG